MKTPTKDKSSMPDVIYAGLMHEKVSDEYELRCAIEKIGVNDEHYTKTSTINAQLDEVIRVLEMVEPIHYGVLPDTSPIDNLLTKLKEMRGA